MISWMIVNDVCSDVSYINGYYNKYSVLLHLIKLNHYDIKQYALLTVTSRLSPYVCLSHARGTGAKFTRKMPGN